MGSLSSFQPNHFFFASYETKKPLNGGFQIDGHPFGSSPHGNSVGHAENGESMRKFVIMQKILHATPSCVQASVFFFTILLLDLTSKLRTWNWTNNHFRTSKIRNSSPRCQPSTSGCSSTTHILPLSQKTILNRMCRPCNQKWMEAHDQKKNVWATNLSNWTIYRWDSSISWTNFSTKRTKSILFLFIWDNSTTNGKRKKSK